MTSTRRRRSRRRLERRYYPVYRPRVRMALTVGGLALMVLVAGVLVWAAVTFK